MAADRQGRILATAMATGPDLSPVQRLVAAAMQMLDLAGAAVVLMPDTGAGVVIANAGAGGDEISRLQFELGEGPSMEAHRSGACVAIDDLAHPTEERWPAFLRGMDPGARSAYVVPLQLGAVSLGVLWLHRSRPGEWGLDDGLDSQAIAELLTTAVLDEHGGLSTEELPQLPDRAVVHQATGMVAAQLDVGLPEALTRLRATAFAEGRPLYDVSVEVVTRRRRLVS